MDCSIGELLEVLVSDVEVAVDALRKYCRDSVAPILSSLGGQDGQEVVRLKKKNFKKSVYKQRQKCIIIIK